MFRRPVRIAPFDLARGKRADWCSSQGLGCFGSEQDVAAEAPAEPWLVSTLHTRKRSLALPLVWAVYAVPFHLRMPWNQRSRCRGISGHDRAARALAELLLAPMSLSLITQLAPPGKSARMVGLWLATTALGNALTGVFGLLLVH